MFRVGQLVRFIGPNDVADGKLIKGQLCVVDTCTVDTASVIVCVDECPFVELLGEFFESFLDSGVVITPRILATFALSIAKKDIVINKMTGVTSTINSFSERSVTIVNAGWTKRVLMNEFHSSFFVVRRERVEGSTVVGDRLFERSTKLVGTVIHMDDSGSHLKIDGNPSIVLIPRMTMCLWSQV